MTEKKGNTTKQWIDPDDAPEWTDEVFEIAEFRRGDQVIRPASGTLKRGRPKSTHPKVLVSLRLDSEVVERFRASGPGWQSRINEALKKAAPV
ncbi:BrnA antitoxin family protein [Brevundimonas sp.]|uniref:BrnA antitoxin family protein n=1 Tax=Brevundimonas sp. TaxID=1871086 RepID=UPI0028977385|nr:BrnA antitoxin family protein [Brevundimonas sp.]